MSDGRELCVVRVWLPDRPGALGQVASRIGAVGGDVIGIEILETGAGMAVDDLTVSLPEGGLIELLIAEIGEVDGVDVEDVRRIESADRNGDLDGLDAAVAIAEGDGDPLEQLVVHVAALLRADWVVVTATPPPVFVRASYGTAPEAAWLGAYLEGVRHLADHDDGPADLAWATLPLSGHMIAAGRTGHPMRHRERRQVASLARLADVLADRRPALQSVPVEPAA